MSIIDQNNSVFTEKVLKKEISYNNPIYSLEIPEQPKFDSILLKAETLNKTTQDCLVNMSILPSIPAQDHDPVEEYDHLVYNRGINEASEDYCTSMGSIV